MSATPSSAIDAEFSRVFDAASRAREFLRATFDSETLEEKVTFIEESLGRNLRKYFTANTGGFLPLAQQRLEIDLNDCVKVNYPKFGKALAKVPALS